MCFSAGARCHEVDTLWQSDDGIILQVADFLDELAVHVEDSCHTQRLTALDEHSAVHSDDGERFVDLDIVNAGCGNGDDVRLG